MKALRFCRQSTTSRGHHGLVIVAVVPCVIFCLLLNVARGDSLCEGCLNGGKLLMPNNIFGYCRCKCFGDYKGPKCQFLYKRSSPAKYLSAAIAEAIAGGGKSANWVMLPQASKAMKTVSWDLPEGLKTADELLAIPKIIDSEDRNEAQLKGLLDKLPYNTQTDDPRDLPSY